MKNYLLLLLICITQNVLSQNTESTNIIESHIFKFDEVQIKPEFPGGIESFYRFIIKNYHLPVSAEYTGKVYLTFVIELDGTIDDIKILKSPGLETEKEAIRVLKKSPKWIPGKNDGVNVRTIFSLPIKVG